MEGDCLFCRIVSGQLPCERVAENELALAINDIHPKAPVHLLILPKLHYHSPDDLPAETAKAILALARTAAKNLGVEQSGYRLVINVGVDSGQEIEHLHLHVLGGRAASAMF
mgnify:CR=1 FL=1